MAPQIKNTLSEAMLSKVESVRAKALTGRSVKNLFATQFQSNSAWEEIVCVGFNPERSQLEAIVNIKRSSGYSGGLCTKGSPEYIRFFIDFNDGNGFQDVGLTSFRAHDISDSPPGPQHPVSYMVEQEVDVKQFQKFCTTEVLVTIRAVLSWNDIPTSDPNQTPSFGNSLDAEAVLKPLKFEIQWPPLLDIIPDLEKLKINTPVLSKLANPQLKEYVKLESKKAEQPLQLKSFVTENIKNQFSSGRILSQIMKMTSTKDKPLSMVDFPDIDKELIDIDGFDFDNAFGELEELDFNTSYEELHCVGLNTSQDLLGAVVKIKRPYGFGGNLCQDGSRQYVAFFADYDNNGTFDEYLGTTSVQVNNISSIPGEGLHYAVFLKTDFEKQLKACQNTGVVRIRAILSWNTPPSTTNADQSVTWGNRKEVLVQLRPRQSDQKALIYSIGNVMVDEIGASSCLAYEGGAGKQYNRPWGDNITIKGGLDHSTVAGSTKYRVEYSENGTNFYPVTTKQSITTVNYSLPFPFQNHILEDANGWFPYLAVQSGSNLVEIYQDVLATWPSHAMNGKYYIRVAFTKSDPITNPGSIQYSDTVRIEVDNVKYRSDNAFDANNLLDSHLDLDMTIDGGVCKTYSQGEKFSGHVKVRDNFYGGYNLNIQPASQVIDPNGLIEYAAKYSTTHTHLKVGDSVINEDAYDPGPLDETFEVDTAKLHKCGYTIRLRGFERTIRNNSHSFPHVSKYLGFSVID